MNPTKGFLSELGRVTYHFQALETGFLFLTATLINEDQRIGQICLARNSFSQLCTVLINLFRHKVDDEILQDKLKAIVSRASELEQERNTLIHSIYLSDKIDEEGIITRAKLILKRNSFRTQFQDITDSDIREVSDRISSLFNDYLAFLSDINQSGVVNLPSIDK